MTDSNQLKRILATVILVALLLFLLYASLPFFNAFAGAFILFYLFKPFYFWLHKKKHLSKPLSASIVIVVVILIVVIPLSFIAKILVSELSSLNLSSSTVLSVIDNVDSLFPEIDLRQVFSESFSAFGSFSKNLLLSTITNVSKIFIDLTIAFFTLYYLLVNAEHLFKNISNSLPFTKKNANLIVDEFENVTHATIVTTGLIALLQGTLLGIGFWVFGVNNPLLWGFIGVLISFLPLIGVPLIWIPAGLILIFAQQRLGAGIGILIWGSVISSIDNFIRPYLQKRFARLHPLITLVGVFIGLPIFGILGIVIGPLLLSYALLLSKIYSEEYIKTPSSEK